MNIGIVERYVLDHTLMAINLTQSPTENWRSTERKERTNITDREAEPGPE